MSTTGRSETGDAVADLATDLASAGFVRVLARADGDALAAAGVLGRALSTLDVPFQVGIAPTAADRRRRAATATDDGDDALTVLVGATPGTDATALPEAGRPASAAAAAVASELGVDPAPTLARAGAVAAGVDPDVVAVHGEADFERDPGLAVPTDDLVDGLAHATLARGPFSGDRTAAADLVAAVEAADDPDAEARRRLASAVAVAASGVAAAEGADGGVERLLRPRRTPAGPFETLGGYADVLAATAATAPGLGVALALGHEVRTDALSAWREHGRGVHATLDDARTSRYDGVFVAQTSGAPPVRASADLLVRTDSPEPTALVLGDGEAGVAATGDVDLREPIRAAATVVDGAADAAPTRGYLAYGTDADVTQLLSAFREAL
jgi:hypothetical protein